MKNIYQIVIILIALVFSGCAAKQDANVELLIGIEKEFLLSLREDLKPSGNTLGFYLETIQDQRCPDVRIEYDLVKKEQEIRFDIQQLTFPEPCAGEEAPASVLAPLGGLTTGTYHLELILQSTIASEGVLEVLDDRYFIQLYAENGIQLVSDMLLKIPEGVVWGYVAYEFPEQESAGVDFLDSLAPLIADISIEDGYYGHFSIENGQVSVAEEADYGIVIPIFGEVTPGFNTEISQLVEQFRTANKDYFKIYLQRWDGTRF